MNKIESLEKLIQKGKAVLQTHKPNSPGVIGFPTLDSQAFTGWKTQCLNFLENNLPKSSSYLEHFKKEIKSGYQSTVESGIGILSSAKEDFENESIPKLERTISPINTLVNIVSKFHKVARQLRSRHDSRETLNVTDEYDVQDLLHSLLILHFDDIRPEEWTPSYAGKSSRMDFLLKNEKIVVEVKKTRSGLGAKELGGQLIEDIERYQSHPDCKTLVCFVYDPEGLVANPKGIENDLARSEPIDVKVYIRPEF